MFRVAETLFWKAETLFSRSATLFAEGVFRAEESEFGREKTSFARMKTMFSPVATMFRSIVNRVRGRCDRVTECLGRVLSGENLVLGERIPCSLGPKVSSGRLRDGFVSGGNARGWDRLLVAGKGVAGSANRESRVARQRGAGLVRGRSAWIAVAASLLMVGPTGFEPATS
jgi:hypothetical protein